MTQFKIFDSSEAWKGAADMYLRTCEIGHTVMSRANVDKYLALKSATSEADVVAALGGGWATRRHCLMCDTTKPGISVEVTNGGVVRGLFGDHICEDCAREMVDAIDEYESSKASKHSAPVCTEQDLLEIGKAWGVIDESATTGEA